MGWPLQVYAGPRAGDFDNVLCGASLMFEQPSARGLRDGPARAAQGGPRRGRPAGPVSALPDRMAGPGSAAPGPAAALATKRPRAARPRAPLRGAPLGYAKKNFFN